jgi:hypothetical protein
MEFTGQPPESRYGQEYPQPARLWMGLCGYSGQFLADLQEFFGQGLNVSERTGVEGIAVNEVFTAQSFHLERAGQVDAGLRAWSGLWMNLPMIFIPKLKKMPLLRAKPVAMKPGCITLAVTPPPSRRRASRRWSGHWTVWIGHRPACH